MATTKEYLLYVLDFLREVSGVTYKKMMGEYILYKDGIIFGGVYDDRFLVKRTTLLENKGFIEQIPYPGAKPMFLVESEDATEIKELVNQITSELTK